MSELGSPRRCVCPGSFDPVTRGHLDVLVRASRLYDDVVATVLFNPDKRGTFSPEERVELITASVEEAGLPNVRVMAFGQRLLVDVCRELDAGVVLKGIRGSTDVEYELPMALMNREMTGVETVLLPGDPSYGHYSSSLIRTIAAAGGDVSQMVPAPVLEPLLRRLRP